MRGASLKAVQELLGHSSIQVTMIYAHLAPRVTRDAVRLLDQRPRSAPASSAPASAEIAAQLSRETSPDPAIPAQLAKDWRNPPDAPVTN